MEEIYIAHNNEKTGEIQTIREHSYNTARLAGEYAVPSLKELVEAIGLLHDVGKYQPSFQKKINGANIKVEHSTCGALAAKEKYAMPILPLMEYCIAGHHTGLPDGEYGNDTKDMTTLKGRMERSFEDYSAYKDEIHLPNIDIKGFMKFFEGIQTLDASVEEMKKEIIERYAFLTRYCFSCLTDADTNDTVRFCQGIENKEMKSDFNKCLEKINSRLSSFECTTEIQKTRSLIQKQVYDKVKNDSEIYLMNMPTGSGKTLCSMKFALERAIAKGKRRIIYIIPYNSIIDQTADEFEKLFGEDAQILRHQSTYSYDDADLDEDYRKTIKAATENWNAQIIITTAVQYFESVYSNKRSRLRKMHNTADSILIFDEAHLMPVNFLQPCLRAISYTTRFLNSEAIFLTATMPDFHRLIKEHSLSDSIITDLTDDTSLFNKFKKCNYVNLGEVNGETLICKAKDNPTTLIVVNERNTARNLYAICNGRKFHLSTYMTALDRKNTINNIKDDLTQLENDYPGLKGVPEERKIIVISTSLIEAGVNLDFSCVYREIAGLDSILQAGGRCNREGRLTNANVYIFSREEKRCAVKKDERAAKEELSQGIISEYSDISSSESINSYYERFFKTFENEISENSLTAKCYTTHFESIKFSEYSDNFKMIEDNNISVVVAQNDTGEELIERLKTTGYTNYRLLQKYTFSIYKNQLEELIKQHAVCEYSGIWCLTNLDYYNSEIGITFEGKDYIL